MILSCHDSVFLGATVPHSVVASLRPLLGAIRIPVPNPVLEPNRCNLEPLKPETPKTTLYLVLPQGRLTLQVVCFGLAHFQLPVGPPKCPSPPTGENPGRPCGGLGGRCPLDGAGVFIAQKHDNLTDPFPGWCPEGYPLLATRCAQGLAGQLLDF